MAIPAGAAAAGPPAPRPAGRRRRATARGVARGGVQRPPPGDARAPDRPHTEDLNRR